jgi:uncharacterized 2Fe-2S/4Fe-4S cluster protein (DUF4445 family)
LPFKVKITPQNVYTTADNGEVLSEVLQRAGISLEAECGGQGTCGTCLMQVTEGNCEWPGSELLSAEMVRDGYVLSCRAEIRGDITVNIPETFPTLYSDDYSRYSMPEPDIAVQAEMSPPAEKVVLEIEDISREESSSDLDRLISAISKRQELNCSLSTLRSLPENLRKENGTVTATVIDMKKGSKIIKLEPGNTSDRHVGFACDIGTTTVALRLVELNTGKIIDTLSTYNDQIKCGADIISRIIYAGKKKRLRELNRLVLNTVNRLLDKILTLHKIQPDDITCAVFSGNTTMTHLFLGINPKYIREEPYVPAVKNVPVFNAAELRINIHPSAVVIFTPAVGSYVGGDITSGVLSAKLNKKHSGLELFIDIGTNGELVIMGEDWMIGCACSAGPAFEGVGIKCGMRASNGAIEFLDIKGDGTEVAYKVIGDEKPRGICGSGLIELTANLFSKGVIDRNGKFNTGTLNKRIRKKNNQYMFIIADVDETATGNEIYISEHDIANIIRAKAAIFSACSLLLKNVGLSFSDIEKVYVAGGFGCYLNIEKAITIGLFPDIALERFEYLGNTSLLGAYLALLSADYRNSLDEIAKSMTYIDLSSEANYMNEYTGALFLPHTDDSLFPSIKRFNG